MFRETRGRKHLAGFAFLATTGVLAASAQILLAIEPKADELAEALASVRDNNHEPEITTSSVLGELAGSAEAALDLVTCQQAVVLGR